MALGDFCDITTGNLIKNCDKSMGGLYAKMYVCNLSQVDEIVSTLNDKEVDVITMAINPSTSLPYYFYSISYKRGTGGFNNELNTGNSVYHNQTLSFSVEGISKESLQRFEELCKGDGVFLVRDMAGKWHCLGRQNGLRATNSTTGSGVAAGDMLGHTITFGSEESELSNLIKPGTQIEVWNGTSTDTITL